MVLWAVIIVKVMSYRTTDAADEKPQQKSALAEKAETERTLLLDYRDPFLEKSKPRLAERQQGSKAVANEKPPDPPTLLFKGTITKGDRIYVMIGDGGPARIFGRGDTVGNYKITTIWADSVSVRKGNHSYILK